MSRMVDYLYHGNAGDDDPAEFYASYDPGIGVDDTVSQKASFRWESQSKRDEGYFETAWFADFRKRWQDDLYRERLNFQARMDAI
jgi:hypothetical protein